MMSHPVVRFEIGCENKLSTQKFYSDVFGWRFKDISPFSSEITDGIGEGPAGAITSLGHEPHQYVTVYVQVDDIEGAISQIKNLGGQVEVGPLPTPDGGKFAWIRDPENNLLAICSQQ